MKQIINKKIDEYKKTDPDKAKDWQNAGLLLDMLAGGLSSPGEGFLGALAGAVNPAVAQIIKGMTTGDNALKEGGLGHILAHGIAGAAMAAANGGDLLSGALTAGGAEALAPIIAEFLYGKGKKLEDFTADEKNTLNGIIDIIFREDYYLYRSVYIEYLNTEKVPNWGNLFSSLDILSFIKKHKADIKY